MTELIQVVIHDMYSPKSQNDHTDNFNNYVKFDMMEKGLKSYEDDYNSNIIEYVKKLNILKIIFDFF